MNIPAELLAEENQRLEAELAKEKRINAAAVETILALHKAVVEAEKELKRINK